MKDVKIIVINDSKKISLAMKLLMQDIYGCEIKFMSADGFKALGMEEKDVVHVDVVSRPNADELFREPKIPSVNLLEPVVEKKSKPYNPRTIGKVNSKKKAPRQRYINKRLGSR